MKIIAAYLTSLYYYSFSKQDICYVDTKIGDNFRFRAW